MFSCSRLLKSLTPAKMMLTCPRMLTCHTSIEEDDLMLFHCYSKIRGNESLSLHFNNKNLEMHKKYQFPFKKAKLYNEHHRIVGTCKGVVCVSDDQYTYAENIYLWNPKTKENLALPEPRVNFNTHKGFDHVLGFGFDEKTQSFIVVRIVHLLKTGHFVPPEVDIYRSSDHKWQHMSHLRKVSYFLGRRQSQVYFNGAAHWLATQEPKFHASVVSFDVSKERFRCFDGPQEVNYNGLIGVTNQTRLAIFKGSLAIVHMDHFERRPISHMMRETALLQAALTTPPKKRSLPFNEPMMLWTVWVMREYGVVGSWTKELSIWGTSQFGRYFLGFGKKGELIVTKDAGFIAGAYFADGTELKVKVVDIDGAAVWCSPVFGSSFRESHVSLRGVRNPNAVREVDNFKIEPYV